MSNWTNDQIELLKKWWSEDVSASQIALRLGDWCTRNAVLGKAHRLHLPAKKKLKTSATTKVSRKPVGQHRKKSKPTETKTVRVSETIVKESVKDVTPSILRSLGLMELSDTTCRWPIGDPHHENFCYCGNDTDGKAYCTQHANLAYLPRQQKGGSTRV